MHAIYKHGQGYWTRLMSAIGLAVVVMMGVAWLWDMLATVRIGGLEPVYVQAGAAVIIIIVAAVIAYWLIGHHQRFVEFLIATEGEMKKVNWSSRREIMGSTAVVIGLTVFIAMLTFTFDLLFKILFTRVGVLEG